MLLRHAVRYLLAIEQVRSKAKQLNLTDAQKDQLKERDAAEKAAAESALLKLYMEVWLPRTEGGSIGIEKIAVGGRPLQTTLDEKKRAMIHQRVIELFTTVQPRVFGSMTPSRIADLFQLGTGDTPKTGVRVCDVVAGFFTFLGFPRRSSDGVVRQAILKGIETSQFGYTTGTPKLGEDGRYQIDHSRVAIGRRLGGDEVDLETGFLIPPSAIPVKPETKTTETKEGDGPTPPIGGGGGAGSGGGTGGGTTGGGTTGGTQPGGGGGDAGTNTVELSLPADRNTLFTAWSVLANLADLAGQVSVTVKASGAQAFDQGKRDNGVLKPLRELGLIEE